MATNVNVVYPPIVNSSIPAFIAKAYNNLNISFSLPLTVNYNNIQHMAIKIVQQSNNKTVVNTNTYYDGIIYLSKDEIKDLGNSQYSLSIPGNSIMINGVVGWGENIYYKIQIRFGYNALPTYTTNLTADEKRTIFFRWKKTQNAISGYSEWSNVIITKSITEPTVHILNNKLAPSLFPDIIVSSSENVETTRFPEFQGGYYNKVESAEPLDKYRFRLYKGKKINNPNDVYLTTGWLQFNGSNNETYSGLVKHVFKEPLEYIEPQFYTVIFDVITKNQYQCSSDAYTFTITENYLKQLNSLDFIVTDNNNAGFYTKKFTSTSDKTFEAYKRIFNLPIDSVKVKLEDVKDIAVKPTDIVYKDNQNKINILTLEERLKAAATLETDSSTDENGCLKIYIRNNKQTIEVFKEQDYILNDDDPNGLWELSNTLYPLDGTYYLIRASEKTNFTVWEDLARFDWYAEDAFDDKLTLLYEDFTVESGVKYKYAFQKENLAGMRSAPKYEMSDFNGAPAHCSNFEHCFIYSNGVQLKLNLDVKIQQFKRTHLFQKQDSLNSQYPIILRNGLANYAEFSLGGKITLHSDYDGSFFLKEDSIDKDSQQPFKGGYYYNGDLVISSDKYLDNYSRIISNDYYVTQPNGEFSKFNCNHTANNVYMERIYRTYVEEFLNNGEYKLYKSPTEGNAIITLVNVSLVPNQQLGRLISDFNSTAYEVADNTLTNIKLYNINPLTVRTNNMILEQGMLNDKYSTVVGQVRGAFDGKYMKVLKISSDLYKELLALNMTPYLYFTKVNNLYYAYDKLPISILNYIYEKTGNCDFTYEKNRHFDNNSDNIVNWIKQQEETVVSETGERQYKLNRISSIWIELYPKYNIEQEILNLKAMTYDTKINKVKKHLQIAKYELMLKQYEQNQSNPITLEINGKEFSMLPGRVYNFKDIDINTLYLKYTRPVLINYTADLEIVDSLKVVTIAKYEISNRGQLNGIFTKNKKILNNHNIERPKNQLIATENKYNYNLYQTLDIMEVIKEKVAKRIYESYGTTLQKAYKELEKQMETFLKEENLILLSFEEQIEQANQIIKNYSELSAALGIENSNKDIWKDNNGHYVIYEFQGLDSIEIEGDENIEIMFNARETYDENGKIQLSGDIKKVSIGPTNKFILKNPHTKFESLRFSNSSFATINYNATISLEIKGTMQEG